MANDLAISANPMRMAQWSYNLVASVISGVIPLSIRAAKNKDSSAMREMMAMFSNKLYQARDAYYASITLGMVQVIVCLVHPFIHLHVLKFTFLIGNRAATASH